MEANSAHFSISARFYQLCSREEFLQYTLQLTERLLDHALARDHYNVIPLPQGRMYSIQRCDQASLASIANDRDAYAFAGNYPITIMRKFIRAYADGHCRMSMQPAVAPNTGEIGRPAQSMGGLHELASVPIHLFHVVGGHSQLMTTPQAPRLNYIPAATRAHTLAKTMHAFPPANLGLPGALG